MNSGACTPRGDGVLEDEAEAARWIRLAAERGYAAAQIDLAFRYASGRGVLKDDAESVRWFRRAAEQGDWRGQDSLGNAYRDGRGVLKDAVLAHMWWNIAGANGSEQARTNRDLVEDEMTPAEISRATELARTCMASNYQDCEP